MRRLAPFSVRLFAKKADGPDELICWISDRMVRGEIDLRGLRRATGTSTAAAAHKAPGCCATDLFPSWMKGAIVREIAATSLLRLCSAAGAEPATAARVTTTTPSHWADVAPSHPSIDGHVPLFCREAM